MCFPYVLSAVGVFAPSTLVYRRLPVSITVGGRGLGAIPGSRRLSGELAWRSPRVLDLLAVAVPVRVTLRAGVFV